MLRSKFGTSIAFAMASTSCFGATTGSSCSTGFAPLANTTSCSGAFSVSGASVSITFAACETLDDAVLSTPTGARCCSTPAAEVGVAPASAVAVAVAPTSAMAGRRAPAREAVEPSDGGAEALWSPAQLTWQACLASSVRARQAWAPRWGDGPAGGGRSALVAGALAAVVARPWVAWPAPIG